MRWPKQVVIGGVPYKIVYTVPSKNKRLKISYGVMDYDKRIILIDKNKRNNIGKFVLFHEIVHGVLECSHIDLEEEQVRPFTHLLFGALIDVGLISED